MNSKRVFSLISFRIFDMVVVERKEHTMFDDAAYVAAPALLSPLSLPLFPLPFLTFRLLPI